MRLCKVNLSVGSTWLPGDQLRTWVKRNDLELSGRDECMRAVGWSGRRVGSETQQRWSLRGCPRQPTRRGLGQKETAV